MTDPARPTQSLLDEHERILAMLEVFGRLADLAEEGTLSLPLAHRALDFVRDFADGCHHQKEEDHLFPALEQCGMPHDQGPIAVMLREHHEGRAAAADMAEGVRSLEDGDTRGAELFARGARDYAAVMREHIDKENEVLFPLAEHLLEAEGKAALAAAFDEVDRAAAETIARAAAALAELGAAVVQHAP